ncbi:plasmid pRiA4b ORF-3 family protein [Rhodococcoides yunnanense]|uniref:plasmid pRiA4b ORF-3 family protein n=1 Tax=Rhodococcoides yunnanense TaxID=278209 RepID=UPI00093485DE|nr:plasmid pRiA4b ORF-3 family protein [Rhodococcus yunnanensis]
MPNRTGRRRHLTVVPDIPIESQFPDVGGFTPETAAHQVLQFVLDVSLENVDTPVWRRIRVRSDLLLPELHSVLQKAMGWNDTHPHAFSVRAGGSTRRFEMQEMLDGGDDGSGVSEHHVRIDSLLTDTGDVVRYEYDFGDNWLHSVRLHAVDTDIDDLRPQCLDGSGACPPEDCGGVGGYRILVDSSVDIDPTAFDIRKVNRRLLASAAPRSTEAESTAASPLVARLFSRTRPERVPRLMELLPRCELTIESSVDLPVATVAMSKLTWFLHRVGERLELAEARYLPGPVVEAIRDELDWGIGWHGASSRELDHHQATDLREAARTLGLVRVLEGSLLRTKVGKQFTDDHVGLWRHCASRLPLGREDHESDAGTLFLIALAASASSVQRDAMIEETMHALGWSIDAKVAGQRTIAFLDLIGAHGPMYYLGRAGSDAPGWSRRFARDALRT